MKNILFLATSAIIGLASAYNNQCNDNIVDYWGQNSYGAANANDPAGWQQPLRFYCDDDTIDVIPISFLTHFFGVGGEPQINLANYCNSVDNGTFPDTNLADCSNIAPDIKYCQSKGKLITLSLGGATGGVGFSTDISAVEFADTLWDQFFGGTSNIRPFGDADLDGVDLDIEGGGPNHYIAFLKQLDTHFKASTKKYYVTAAPQCVYPDANLQATLDGYPFDAVYIQFYNNPCGLQNFNSPSQWNYGTWDIWARTISPNPNVKIYIGAPASISAAGGGYVTASTLLDIAQKTRDNFPSFGGVMFWDASQARQNNRIDKFIKDGLSSGKKCDNNFVFPECKDPAFVQGNNYMVGTKVAYNGYIWTPKWWTATAPNGAVNSDWSAIGTCAGGTLGNGDGSITTSSIPATSTTTSTSTTTTTRTSITTTTIRSLSTYSDSLTDTNKPTSILIITTTVTVTAYPSTLPYPSTSSTLATTSVASTSTSTPLPNNDCDATEWSRTSTYTGGMKVVYNSVAYKAAWWSLNEAPDNNTGAWIKLTSCPKIVARSVDCKHARWTGSRTYKTGSKVTYKGSVYIASSLNNNQFPDADASIWSKDLSC